MCGRFALTSSKEKIIDFFGIQQFPENWEPSYNIGPATPILTVIQANQNRKAGFLHWGFIPSWAKGSKKEQKILINAKSETIFEKPSFKKAILQRRCLIISNGFYEWQNLNQSKQPYWICSKKHKLIAFAGIYEKWMDQNTPYFSCAIITAPATPDFEMIHSRMPVVIEKSAYACYLDNKTDPRNIAELLKSPPLSYFKAQKVSPFVNSIRNQGSHCQSENEPDSLF